MKRRRYAVVGLRDAVASATLHATEQQHVALRYDIDATPMLLPATPDIMAPATHGERGRHADV